MSGLRDHIESVGAESLAATGDDHQADDAPIVDAPVADTPEPPTGEGRTIDNVHGEFSRKFGDIATRQGRFEDAVMRRLDDLASKISGRQPEQQQPKTKLEDYSVAELTAYLNGLPADNPQRAQVEGVIADKIVNDKVRDAVKDITGREQAKAAKRESLRVAVERYPDLKDETSPFWQAVDRELRYRGDGYAQTNPNAVLDVANEMAQRMGVTAKRNIRTTPRVPDRPGANRRDHAAPVQSDEQFAMSEEDALKIAGKLEAALGRKFKPEEIKKIRENHASYKGAQNLFVRG